MGDRRGAGAELSGEFDFENVPEIERFLRRRLGPFFFKGRDLVLDLAGVEMVDSAFVGLVVSLVRRLHANRRELLITRPGVTCGAPSRWWGCPTWCRSTRPSTTPWTRCRAGRRSFRRPSISPRLAGASTTPAP